MHKPLTLRLTSSIPDTHLLHTVFTQLGDFYGRYCIFLVCICTPPREISEVLFSRIMVQIFDNSNVSQETQGQENVRIT